MSNYTAKTVHPLTGVIEDAQWLDDYFGRHQYAVKFLDGHICRPHECEIAPEKQRSIKGETDAK